LILLQLRTQLGKEKGRRMLSSNLLQIMAPHTGQSSQLVFNAPTAEMKITFDLLRQGPLDG